MRYTVAIEINQPREQMLEIFDNFENLTLWMPGLISLEHISGTPGHVDAKSKFVVSMGKRSCEMIETITVRDMPVEFTATYETDGMWNQVKNIFDEVDAQTTRWTAYNEFRSDKLMMKLMMLIMPWAFKKESLK
ncbi:SRPBCC family protein, partial [Aliiglaciecola sp.]|nr:SRPBCC family protein [Aliiglaciecola sp.]